jgi:hypothetical protein
MNIKNDELSPPLQERAFSVYHAEFLLKRFDYMYLIKNLKLFNRIMSKKLTKLVVL